jgi:hypothetical protein
VAKFSKGHKKTGGKRKGTRNKKTLMLDNFAKVCVEGGMERFKTELMKLKGGNYVKNFMALLEFVQPKLARTEHTGKDGAPILPITGMTFEDATKVSGKSKTD